MDAKAFGALYVLIIALIASLIIAVGVIVYWVFPAPSASSEVPEVPSIRANR